MQDKTKSILKAMRDAVRYVWPVWATAWSVMLAARLTISDVAGGWLIMAVMLAGILATWRADQIMDRYHAWKATLPTELDGSHERIDNP
jgi:hypothetical protein